MKRMLFLIALLVMAVGICSSQVQTLPLKQNTTYAVNQADTVGLAVNYLGSYAHIALSYNPKDSCSTAIYIDVAPIGTGYKATTGWTQVDTTAVTVTTSGNPSTQNEYFLRGTTTDKLTTLSKLVRARVVQKATGAGVTNAKYDLILRYAK